MSYTYIQFDAKDRSGIGVFKDKRVREALLKAIDRPALIKAFVPQEHWNDPVQPAMCHDWHIGCSASLQPPAYDLEGAKKLLAEAGYPNGFELSITTWGAVAAHRRGGGRPATQVGINAKVDASTIGVFVQKRADGKIQTAGVAVGQWRRAAGYRVDHELLLRAEFARRDRRSDPCQGGR